MFSVKMICLNLKPKQKCSVPRCEGSNRLHSFPRDRALAQKWLLKINNDKLKGVSFEHLYKYKKVCSLHFKLEDYRPKCGRPLLNRDVVPSCNLNYPLPIKQENMAVSSISTEPSTSTEHNTSMLESPKGIKRECLLSSSCRQELGSKIPRSYFGTEESAPSTSGEHEIGITIEISPPNNFEADDTIPSTSGKHELSNPIIKTSPHNDSVSSTSDGRESESTITKRSNSRSRKISTIRSSRQIMLPPKACNLYKKVVAITKEASRLNTQACFKEKLKLIETVANQLEAIFKNVNPSTCKFIMSQVRTQLQKPTTKKFTLDEKILALHILKCSARGYELLSNIFSLPSKASLTKLLNNIPFPAGVETATFYSLECSVRKLAPIDRIAILIFDEMYLDLGLSYNFSEDNIIGFHDLGSGVRKPFPCDYVNVFMVKGVFKQWQQPLCYTFTDGPINAIDLKDLIKKIIRKCHECGLSIVATVCDQGSANVAAIKILLQETQEYFSQRNEKNNHFGFLIDEKEIVPLFDGPLLLKGLRNNLLTRNLHFVKDGISRVAKWDHIEQLYKFEKKMEMQMCNKLTDQHVIRGIINKKNVKHCAQVFSKTVGKAIIIYLSYAKLLLENTSNHSHLPLENESYDTAQLLLFLDELFDSLNSSTCDVLPGKPLQGAVTSTSGHIHFWKEALVVLSSMRFMCLKKQTLISVPPIVNLAYTIKGLIYLCPKLLKEGKFVKIRPFQKDSLEIFFENIRSVGGVSPTPEQFVSSFKRLIVNSYLSQISPGCNGEEYLTDGLNDLRRILTDEVVTDAPFEQNFISLSMPSISVPVHIVKYYTKNKTERTYMSSFITKKVLRIIKCEGCRAKIIYRYNDAEVVKARQCDLPAPETYFHSLVNNALSRLFYILPRLCANSNLTKILDHILCQQMAIFFNAFNCPKHPEQEILIRKIIIRSCLFRWMRKINRITIGKGEKLCIPKTKCNIDKVQLYTYKKYMAKIKKLRNKNSDK
ncbi:uncharacterized protein LOC143189952 isoform X2 [Rhynchophorus ferrugineus]|uniref:uncharacterized protein LOC143189952 isoform X2 n=1 Tax=Rhynchophorus ferrugineus TaxID=354439 RepID=UPI003FCE0F3F